MFSLPSTGVLIGYGEDGNPPVLGTGRTRFDSGVSDGAEASVRIKWMPINLSYDRRIDISKYKIIDTMLNTSK